MIGDDRVREGELLHAARQRTQHLLDEAARLVQHVRAARVLVDPLVQVAVPVQLDHVALHVRSAARLDELDDGGAALERRRVTLREAGGRRNRRQVHHGQAPVLLGDGHERGHLPLVLLAPVLGAARPARLLPLPAARVREAAQDVLVVAGATGETDSKGAR